MTTIVMLMPESHLSSAFTPAALDRLRSIGDVHVAPTATEHDDPRVRGLLASAEILVTGTGTRILTSADLDHAPHLQVIVHAAGSLRPIVGVEAYDRGIRLASQAGVNAIPVAEYTLAMILLELKGARAIEQSYRDARTAVDVDAILADHGAYGAHVGIISASSIGRRVIELLEPHDVQVSLYDPFVEKQEAARLGVGLLELDTIFAQCDVVSVHAPLLPETTAMIGATQLRLLRTGSVLINTARGALIDEPALLNELSTGRFRAVIDVTDPETPAADSPLWSLPNVVLTPHIAGSRGRELRRIGDAVVEDVEAYVDRRALPHEVLRHQYQTNA